MQAEVGLFLLGVGTSLILLALIGLGFGPLAPLSTVVLQSKPW